MQWIIKPKEKNMKMEMQRKNLMHLTKFNLSYQKLMFQIWVKWNGASIAAIKVSSDLRVKICEHVRSKWDTMQWER